MVMSRCTATETALATIREFSLLEAPRCRACGVLRGYGIRTSCLACTAGSEKQKAFIYANQRFRS